MSSGFVPDMRITSVEQINRPFLKKHSISGLIVDLDNTLALPDDAEPTDEALRFAERMHALKIPVIVVSNNNRKRVADFCSKLGFDYVHKAGKPFGAGIGRAIRKLGVARENVAIVGDQLLTDVLAASCNRMRSVLTEPIVLEKGFFFQLKRGFEWLIDRNRRKMRCSKKIWTR